jgi:ABC-type glutathione transport system ATPase component
MHPLLEVLGLRVDYRVRGEDHAALEDVTFSLLPGEIVGIVGESGSGKSTLGLAISGLLPANATVRSGTIVFQGRDLLRLTDPAFEKIRGAELAFLSQEPAAALNPVIRIGDQITEVIRAHLPWDRRARLWAAQALLEQVRLHDVNRAYKAYPHELSGGERQRAALAVALACLPTLLIADEPSTSLDVFTQSQILGVLKDLRSNFGLAILIITHDVSALAEFADRIIVLCDGRIVEDRPSHDVWRSPVHPYTTSLLSSVKRLSISHDRQ